MTLVFGPAVILCGWLGSNHLLTNFHSQHNHSQYAFYAVSSVTCNTVYTITIRTITVSMLFMQLVVLHVTACSLHCHSQYAFYAVSSVTCNTVHTVTVSTVNSCIPDYGLCCWRSHSTVTVSTTNAVSRVQLAQSVVTCYITVSAVNRFTAQW